MRAKRLQTWRSLAAAALLLFAAGQLLEQSHFHTEVDSQCAVCTHADGHCALISSEPVVADVPTVQAGPATASAKETIPCRTYRPGPRAPPEA